MSPSSNPNEFIPSLKDKVILVTGGNIGLGKETILQLAKHKPAKIYMASRTESKARDAIKSINAQLKEPASIEYLPLDLSSLKSVQAAAQHVNASSQRLDILILNAGIMAVPATKTESGHDIQLGTNHIGHFTLDQAVAATAREDSSPAEIGHVIISKEKLEKTGNWTRYGASKASNILFAAEMARRYPSFKTVSVHPGYIKTDLWKPNSEHKSLAGFFIGFGEMFGKGVQEGALNQLWCAAGIKRDGLRNGGYYTPVGKLKSINKWANDREAGKKLWDWTDEQVRKAGY